MDDLLTGASSVDITPRGPQWLDGYGTRVSPSEGVYLPISVRSLALRMRGQSALLLSAEVLAFDRARVLALKQRLQQATGFPAEGIVLAATHTHCAPRVCDMVMPGIVDREYVAWFEERCVESAVRACEALAPARLAFSRAEEELGVNRRVLSEQGVVMRPNPAGPRDRELDTLWFEDLARGRVLASLTVAACHPTCRGGQQIGGDYPGFLLRELGKAVEAVALFALGCAGDVRPGFTDAEGRFRMAELPEVLRAGETMADQVLLRRPEREYPACEALRVARRVVEMPLAEPPGEEELQRIAEGDASPLRRLWARQMLERGIDRLPRSVSFELQALAFDPGLTLLFWPGEIAAEYALWIKQQQESPGERRVVAAAYANGAVGYVPSAAMIPLGGYEVNGSHFYYNLPAPYAPEIEARLRAASLELLADLHPPAELPTP